MKKAICLLLAFVLAASVVGCSGSPGGSTASHPTNLSTEESIPETPFAGQAIVWDDPEVENAVRTALNKPEGDILGEEAAMVKSISLPDSDIWDLRDFKYLTGLEELDLSGNHLRDLDGLESLSKLRTLNLSRNQLRDLSPLKGLSALEELTLSQNSIVDLTPLTELLALQKLNLSGNRIVDLSPLAGLIALEELDLSVPDFLEQEENVNQLQKEDLYYLSNDPETLAPLSGLTKLRILNLDGLPLTDLSPIENSESLRVLSARRMPVLHLGSCVLPKNLEELDLSSTRLSTVEPLGRLTGLKKLILGLTPSNYDFLQNLTGLTELDIPESSVTDPQPFAGLTQLTSFNANCFREEECDRDQVIHILSGMKELTALQCPWSYIEAVASLPKLEEVDTSVRGYFLIHATSSENYVDADPSALAQFAALPNLRVLNLIDNNETLDLSLLAGSPIETLVIDGCTELENLPSLAQLANLKDLKLHTDLRSTDISALSSLPALKKLDLSDCGLESLPVFPKANSPLEELILDGNPCVSTGDLSAFSALRTLSLQESSVEDLSGLAGLTQLEELTITSGFSPNNVTLYDSTPLAGLSQLQKLTLSTCSDMNFLTNLSELRELSLNCYSNKQDPTPLAGLTKLETLSLRNCSSDIPLPSLSNLKNLRKLELTQKSECLFPNFSGLVGLPSLEEVILSGCDPIFSGEPIPETPVDLVSLSSLPNLKNLSCTSLTFPDPAPLAALPRLRELRLSYCQTPEQMVFQGPASLRCLTGSGCRPQDLAALTGLRCADFGINVQDTPNFDAINALSNLTELELYINSAQIEGTLTSKNLKSLTVHNYGPELDFLSGLTELEYLDISDTAAGDLSALSSLNSLKVLHADAFHRSKPEDMPMDEFGVPYPKIQDLTPLSSLTELEELTLNDNQISDLSPLKSLPMLQYLNVNNNPLSDLSLLAPLPSLRVLRAASTVNPEQIYVNNISGFEGMTGLCYLDLTWNQIADITPLGSLTRLRNLNLSPEYHFSGISDPTPLLGLTRLEDGHLRTTTRAQADLIENSHLNISCSSAEDPW